MEGRDQFTQDNVVRRPWRSFTDEQHASLLIEFAASLRRRLHQVELDPALTRAYRTFAHAAQQTGEALLRKTKLPFVPDPPYQWYRLPLEEVDQKGREITDWAAKLVLADEQPLYLREAAFDLKRAGYTLEICRERSRTR